MQDEAGTSLSASGTPDRGATRIDERASHSRGSSDGPARRGTLAVALGCALLVVLLDQASKAWALATLDGRPRPLIGDLVTLRLIRNPGAAFSLGAGFTLVMTIVAVTITAALVVVLRRTSDRPLAIGLGAVLGGALGNLLDRVLREPGPGRGHVVDFLDYGGLFVGNVADIAIVLAGAYVAWRWQAADPRSEAPHDESTGEQRDG